jgi:NAD(P) transhydrogenase
MDYELLVIGNDRAGFESAIEVAQDGGKVAIVESSLPIPSMSLLQSAASNVADRGTVSLAGWKDEVARLQHLQRSADRAELDCLGIVRLAGKVRFLSGTTIEVSEADQVRTITSTEIVVACGTRSRHSTSCPVDGRFVLNADSLLDLIDLPQSTIVVGAGESGLSAAVLLATLNVDVTAIDEHASIFDICHAFDGKFEAAQSLNIGFRLGEEVIGTEHRPDMRVAVRSSSGRIYVADTVVVCIGREGATEGLDLERAGVGLDERGRVWCNTEGATWTPTITAVGSVMWIPRTRSLLAGLSI